MSDLIPHVSVSEYRYQLPEERIPDRPLEDRDQSKLLVYRKGEISQHIFSEIPHFVPSSSLLVFNNSKVIPARLHFQTPTTAWVELLCLHPLGIVQHEMDTHAQSWKCVVGNLKRWKEGVVLEQTHGIFMLKAELLEKGGEENTVRFSWSGTDSFFELLEALGEIPLPPYMHRQADHLDKTRYQTVYAGPEGSVAAPTAGLHFTQPLLETLHKQGISQGHLTLHVGAGTFKPIKTDDAASHTMHQEFFELDKSLIHSLLRHSFPIAVGTTSMRTLESLYHVGCQILDGQEEVCVAQWDGFQPRHATKEQALQAILDYMDSKHLQKLVGSTRIMIVPGYSFRICKGLVTNFHQPESSLILLVAAFVGKDWEKIYRFALENDFRFLSYGDSSLLFP